MNAPPRDVATDVGLVTLTVIWGVNFSVVKAVLVHLDPLALNALRFPLAAAVLWLLVRRLPGPGLEREDRWRLVGLGLLGNVVYQVCFVEGIDRTLAGNASLLLATSPVWTVLLSAAVGHERPTRLVLGGSALTVAGMVLVVVGRGEALAVGADTLWGDALMVAAAVLWATFTVGSSRLVHRYGSVRVTAWTLWSGTPVLVAIGAPELAATDWGAVPSWAWAGVVYAGVFSVGVAYMLWYRGVRRLGNSRTAVYSNLVPVTALLTAWVWLGEVPTGWQVGGAGVILGGIYLARQGRQRPEPSSLRWRTSGNS
ncbi:MAG TPA: DMT family transporter [Longimicrobiales bacterium]|nr:DMT family transporter [Longimicrobiales bacterium]